MQLGEGMAALEEHSSIARKYCGGGELKWRLNAVEVECCGGTAELRAGIVLLILKHALFNGVAGLHAIIVDALSLYPVYIFLHLVYSSLLTYSFVFVRDCIFNLGRNYQHAD